MSSDGHAKGCVDRAMIIDLMRGIYEPKHETKDYQASPVPSVEASGAGVRQAPCWLQRTQHELFPELHGLAEKCRRGSGSAERNAHEAMLVG